MEEWAELEGDKGLHSIQREENEQSTHPWTHVHGKAVPAGESKWGYGRFSRNRSRGLRFRVRFEEPWEIWEGVWTLF